MPREKSEYIYFLNKRALPLSSSRYGKLMRTVKGHVHYSRSKTATRDGVQIELWPGLRLGSSN